MIPHSIVPDTAKQKNYIEVTMNGQVKTCLIDTGSAKTIFPLAMVQGLVITPGGPGFTSAEGTVMTRRDCTDDAEHRRAKILNRSISVKPSG